MKFSIHRQLQQEIDTQRRMKQEISQQFESVLKDRREQLGSKRVLEDKIKSLTAQKTRLQNERVELKSIPEQEPPSIEYLVRV